VTRVLAIVLLLAFACAGAVWLVSHRSTEPLSTPLPAQAQPAPASEAARALESEPAVRAHLPAAPPPRVISSKPDPIVGPKAVLEFVCVSNGDGRALPGVSIHLERELEEQEVQIGAFDDTPEPPRTTSRGVPARGWKTITDDYFTPASGEDGHIALEVPAGVELSGSARSRGFPSRSQSFSCRPLLEGEHRRVSLGFPAANDARFRGIVVEAAGGEPLAGVEVSSYRSSQSEHLATTGNDGRFDVLATTWLGTELRMEKSGFVAQRVHVDPQELAAQGEHLFAFVRSAVVQGFVRDAQGEQIQMGSICMRGPAGTEFRAFLDSQGWYSIDGLPPATNFEVCVERWRSTIFRAEPPGGLECGETRRLDLRLPPR